MTEISRTYDQNAAVMELRSAMDRVRDAQIAGGLAVNLARYDVVTEPVNREFLENFLTALPVDLTYSGNYPGDTTPTQFAVKDPVDLRATAGFGVFLEGTNLDRLSAGLVIGQRSVSGASTPLTELLVASQVRKLEEGNWRYSPTVYTATVLSKEWHTLRERGLSNLATPYDVDLVASGYSAELGACVLGGYPNRFGVARITGADYYNSDKERAMIRSLSRGTSLKDGVVAHGGTHQRALLGSDFEQFDVMSNLEYLAAAYGVGGEFDVIKARREASLPTHPVEDTFGLGGYRRAIEGDVQPLILPQ